MNTARKHIHRSLLAAVLTAAFVSAAPVGHAYADWQRCAGAVQYPGDYAGCTLGDESGPFDNGPYVRIDYKTPEIPDTTLIQLSMCPFDSDPDSCLGYRGPYHCRLTTLSEDSESFSGGSWMVTFEGRLPYVYVDCDTQGWNPY